MHIARRLRRSIRGRTRREDARRVRSDALGCVGAGLVAWMEDGKAAGPESTARARGQISS